MEVSKSGKVLGDYKVGYGRPPQHSKYRKGQTGNPKGRPRKVRAHKATEDMRREYMAAMEQEVTVIRDGRKRKVPAIIALYEQVLAKALNGDFRAMKLACEMYRACVTEDEDQRMRLLQTVLEYDKAMEEKIQAEIKRMTPEERERKAAAEMARMSARSKYTM